MNCNSRKCIKAIVYLSLVFASLYLSACAVKPWTEPLANHELYEAENFVLQTVEGQNICGETIGAELSLLVESPFNKDAVSGFFQWSQPSNFKFVVTNPFGQPVLIIIGDQKFFSSINTLSRSYTKGSLSSFAIRNNLSVDFIEGNWHEWLTGSKALKNETIYEIRNSSDLKGIWVTFKDRKRGGLEHILIDREQKKITRRLLEGPGGENTADIYYKAWTEVEDCTQPSEILVTGLDMGAEISFKLSDISISKEPISTKIAIPYGYSKTYLP